MTNDVIQMKLKVNLGINQTCYFIKRCKCKKKVENVFFFKGKTMFLND